MNLFNRYLPPLISDYSALHLFFYNKDATVFLLSPGGCNQVTREVDEYRPMEAAKLYTTKLNDAHIAFGLENIIGAKTLHEIDTDSEFLVLLGSSVPNIVGTNFAHIAKSMENHSGKKVIPFQTNGFDSYSKAIAEAYEKMFELLCETDELDLCSEDLLESEMRYDKMENFNAQKNHSNQDDILMQKDLLQSGKSIESPKKIINLIGYNPIVHGHERFLHEIIALLQHDEIEICLDGTNAFQNISVSSENSFGEDNPSATDNRSCIDNSRAQNPTGTKLLGNTRISVREKKISPHAQLTLVLSEEAISLAKLLEEKYLTPYERVLPISRNGACEMVAIVEKYLGICLVSKSNNGECNQGIIQKICSNDDFLQRNHSIQTAQPLDNQQDILPHDQTDNQNCKTNNLGNANCSKHHGVLPVENIAYQENPRILLFGEPFFSAFLKKSLQKDFGISQITIISPFEKAAKRIFSDKMYEEIHFDTTAEVLLSEISKSDVIIGDPLLKEVFPEIANRLIPLPFVGLSGREFVESAYEYIGEKGYHYFKKYLQTGD